MKLLALSLLPAVIALPQSPWHAREHAPPDGSWGKWPHHHPAKDDSVKAAYFLDNDPAGSSIVALKIDGEGKVSDPVRTSTGGVGSIGVNATGFPNQADSLMSQGAVVVSGNMLFTVNAGSDTVVMFRIDPEDPWHPRMIGKPASTQGQFPVSVAYSPEFHTVCVLNGGAVAGVSCFEADPNKGLHAQGSLRSLGGTINETTPATGPPGSAGQIVFDPKANGVFALIKGDPTAEPPRLGSIVGFSATHDGVSADPIISQFDNVFLDFSGTWLSDTRLFLTDPAFGIAYIDMQRDLKFTQAVHTVVPTQKAICWNIYDESTGTAYAIDAGLNVMFTIDTASGALAGNVTVQTDGVEKDAGLFDTALDAQSSLAYSLTGGNGIVVTNLQSGAAMQYLDLSSFGDRQGYQGMALF